MSLNTAETISLFSSNLKKVLGVTALLLICMTGFRLLYLLLYGSPQHWTGELPQAFSLGLRFDLSVLAYVSIIPVISLCLSVLQNQETWHHRLTKFLSVWYRVWGFVVFLILSIDVGYYTYFQDHLNILVFGFFEDDTMALLRTFWKNYPILWISLAVVMAFCIWSWLVKKIFSPINFRQRFERISAFWKLPLILCVLSLTGLAARGSLGLFPLGEADAVIGSDPFMNLLPTNGIHTLARAIKLKNSHRNQWNSNLQAYGYSSPKQAFSDFYQIPIQQLPENPLDLFEQTLPANPWAEQTKPHVVIVMMESFGSYWMQFHSDKFNLLGDLEPHFTEDLLFRNFVPATGSTIGSISALMINAPHRPLGPFLTESQFLQVRFPTSPARVYKEAGYKTRFIYGGAVGWRDLNKFAHFQGFESIEGEPEIEKLLGPLKDKHDWGVYDADVFQYVLKTLETADQPQLVVVLTTTNHPPYQVPRDFVTPRQELPETISNGLIVDKALAMARFQVYYYAADQLGKFITQIKSSSLKDRVIMGATGDHNFYLVNFSDAQLLQKWSVPFYLYVPPEMRQTLGTVDLGRFGSHMDIFPTVARLSLSNSKMRLLGNDLLAPTTLPQNLAAFHSSGLAVNSEGAVINLGPSKKSYFLWNADKTQLEPASETPGLSYLGLRYQSLMSLLDFYFFEEQKNQRQ